MSWRRCVFRCEKKASLFALPKDEATKNRWLHFMYSTVPDKYSPNIQVCAAHFADECFKNLGEIKAGCARKLCLKSGAIPTITAAQGQSGTSDSAPIAPVNQLQFSFQPKLCCDVGCQTEVFTKDTTCQTDVDLPIKRHASTQYTWKSEQRIQSSQIKLHEKLVICSSHTSVKESPLASASPLKRPRREATYDLTSHPEETDLNICKERLCSKNISAQRIRKLQKSTHVPAPTVHSKSDSSHPGENHPSSYEDTEVHREEPSCQTDKPVLTKLNSEDQLISEDQIKSEDQLMSEVQIKSEDQLISEDQIKSEDQLMSEDQIKSEHQFDLDISKVSFATALENADIVPQSSTSRTTKEEMKEEPVETEQQPENRLEVSTAPSDEMDHNNVQTLNPVTVGNRVMHKDRHKNSDLMGLFPTCLQCGGPVLEYTTVSSGDQNRLQWKCSQGHLMWLFPNSNPT